MNTVNLEKALTTEQLMQAALETVKQMSPEEKAELREALRRSDERG